MSAHETAWYPLASNVFYQIRQTERGDTIAVSAPEFQATQAIAASSPSRLTIDDVTIDVSRDAYTITRQTHQEVIDLTDAAVEVIAATQAVRSLLADSVAVTAFRSRVSGLDCRPSDPATVAQMRTLVATALAADVAMLTTLLDDPIEPTPRDVVPISPLSAACPGEPSRAWLDMAGCLASADREPYFDARAVHRLRCYAAFTLSTHAAVWQGLRGSALPFK